MLWALGNFSRFIRPGMVRIEVDRSDGLSDEQTAEGLMVSGYRNEVEKILVTIFVNYQYGSTVVKPAFQGLPAGMGIIESIPYVTSATDALYPYVALQAGEAFRIPARSVVTLVTHYELIGKGLVGRWRFDGDLLDDRGQFPGQALSPHYDVGIVDQGQALVFNGAGSVVEVADSADFFNFYPAGYSVSAWVRTEQPGWGAIVAKQDRSSPWRGWVLTTDGNSGVSALRQVHGDLYGVKGIKDNQWHLVTATYDPEAARARLYLDGLLDNEMNTDTTIAPIHAEPLVFGAETTDGFSPYVGLIDDIRIYNYPLDNVEVARLYREVYDIPLCIEEPQLDWNHDCRVDIDDLMVLVGAWLNCNLFPSCY